MEQENISSFRAWGISLTGALFFFYVFLQMNLMTPLSGSLSQTFGIGSGEMGLLSAWIFYSNVLFLIPAGFFLDRICIRKLMVINLGIGILGTLIFALAPNFFVAAFGRFLTGIMVAFGLIICLKLASQYLPPSRLSLASSLIISIGMLGGVVSQTPLVFLLSFVSWRIALVFVALLGGFFAFILWITLPSKKVEKIEEKEALSLWTSLTSVLKQKQNWLSGFFIGLFNLPLAVMGALFGITFLGHVHGIESLQAASITSMLFLGMIVGSSFFGWLVDHWGKRRPSMLIGGILCFFLTLIAIDFYPLNAKLLYFLFFAIGFTSASQVLGYSVVSENNNPKVTGSALSLVAMIIMGGGYGLALPFVGIVLDWTSASLGTKYAIEAYQRAFFLLPVGIFLGTVIAFFLKESPKK